MHEKFRVERDKHCEELLVQKMITGMIEELFSEMPERALRDGSLARERAETDTAWVVELEDAQYPVYRCAVRWLLARSPTRARAQ